MSKRGTLKSRSISLKLSACACLITASTIAAERAAPEYPRAFSRLAGAWRVVKVDLEPGPVQALRENDPEYMGAILEITPDRLSWRRGKGGAFTDVCDGPGHAPDGSVVCNKGVFGYAGAQLKIIGGRIRLEWYDNAILVLERVRDRR